MTLFHLTECEFVLWWWLTWIYYETSWNWDNNDHFSVSPAHEVNW